MHRLSVIAVSSSVSPFLMEEVPTDMLMTSPPRRLPASSKLVRVRVEFSKNRLATVRPRRLTSSSVPRRCPRTARQV